MRWRRPAALKGAFALALLFEGEENLLIGARRGAPLAVGFGEGGEMYLGSDALALAPSPTTITYLEEDDWVTLTRGIRSSTPRRVSNARSGLKTGSPSWWTRAITGISWPRKSTSSPRWWRARSPIISISPAAVRLPFDLPLSTPSADAPHHLRLRHRLLRRAGRANIGSSVLRGSGRDRRRLGISLPRGAAARERADDRGVAIGRDRRHARRLRFAKAHGQMFSAIVNVQTSTIARESDVAAPTLAGPEIGVASTKAFTCQLTVFAGSRWRSAARAACYEAEEKRAGQRTDGVPGLMAEALKDWSADRGPSRAMSRETTDVLYLGRGTSYPLALEGALKLKEISYIHAEGYAAGELKHGPIALIDRAIAGDRDRAD